MSASALVRANAAGSYLFVDVTIDADARPGPRRLLVRSPARHRRRRPSRSWRRSPRAGPLPGLLVRRRDLPHHARPLRERRSRQRRPSALAGPPRPHAARYYHGGDLQGIIERLPYLKDLGVTALWLNPWYDNVNHLNEKERYDGQPITDYHGYGAVDFYGVEEHFGTLATLRELVDAAHRQGLKVIQDQVANHTGPYHPWVDDPPTPTWFNGTAERHLANTWQTWTLGDPHATRRDAGRRRCAGWFIDILPDLNQDDEEVARYLDPEHALVGGRDRPRRHPPGHPALRPAPLLARLDGRDQARVPAPHAWSASCSTATRRSSPSSRAAPRGFDGIDTGIDTPLRLPALLPAAARLRGRQADPGAGPDARPRPALPEAGRARDVPGSARRPPLHERAGRDGGRPEARVHVPADRPRHPAHLLRRRDRDAGRRRSGQPARLPGRLAGRCPKRLRGGRPHRRRAIGLRAGPDAESAARRARRRCGREPPSTCSWRSRSTPSRAPRARTRRSWRSTTGARPRRWTSPVVGLGLGEGETLEDRLGGVQAITVAGGRLRFTLPPRSAAVLTRRR